MIKINIEKKTILFSKPYDGEESTPLREYPLLMGYQCPECHQLILAYFTTAGSFDINPYIEAEHPDYRTFWVSGAAGLQLADHDSKYYSKHQGIQCPWMLCGALAVDENINQILRVVYEVLTEYQYDNKPPVPTVADVSSDVVQYLIALEGVKRVGEICGRGEPMFLVNKHSLIGFLQAEAGQQPSWRQQKAYKAWETRRKKALQGFIEKVSGGRFG